MARRMNQVTVYLEPEQLEQLRSLSKRTGLPMSVIQRRGIELILDREEERLRDAQQQRTQNQEDQEDEGRISLEFAD